MGTDDLGATASGGADAETATSSAVGAAPRKGLRLSELLLTGVIVVMVTCLALAVALYVLPTSRVEIPELQPAVRVGEVDNFPSGASRVVSWGHRVILVIHTRGAYFALQGDSPYDGCILEWEAESSRIISPCTRVIYDLQGNVVVGLSRAPLRPYSAFVRDGLLYVTE